MTIEILLSIVLIHYSILLPISTQCSRRTHFSRMQILIFPPPPPILPHPLPHFHLLLPISAFFSPISTFFSPSSSQILNLISRHYLISNKNHVRFTLEKRTEPTGCDCPQACRLCALCVCLFGDMLSAR